MDTNDIIYWLIVENETIVENQKLIINLYGQIVFIFNIEMISY